MRLLHTGDWHVGRGLRGRSRADEHRAALAEIVAIAGREAVELVLVAGDLFDTSAPTAEAERIVYDALLGLAETGADVVVIAGNHDHPERLAAVRALLALGRVRVLAHPARPDDGGIVEIERAGGRARVALLPFLSQRGIVTADALMTGDAPDHVQAYAERCRSIVAALCAGFGDDAVNVLVAHLTVVGGRLGGGERDAHTVFDYHVPSQVFPATAHYVALGHLHRAQQVPAGCPAWYCGSPLQLDFGEGANEPCVLLVEAEPGTPATVRTIPLASGRRLRTLRGSLAQLEALKDETGGAFLRVFVQEAPRPGLADAVRDIFGDACVDVSVEHESVARDGAMEWQDETFRRSPIELFGEYLAESGIEDSDLSGLFGELLEELRADE